MKVYWTMPKSIKAYYNSELDTYRAKMQTGEWRQAWHHLERAHILGQPWFVQHSFVHWLMLGFGIKSKNGKEILGQIPRLLAGGVKSFAGKIPTGNTGGANVPPLKTIEIPADLQLILDKVKLS